MTPLEPFWTRHAERLFRAGGSVPAIAALLSHDEETVAEALRAAGCEVPAARLARPTPAPLVLTVAGLPSGADGQLVIDLSLNEAVDEDDDAPAEAGEAVRPSGVGLPPLVGIVEEALRRGGKRGDATLRYACGETLAEIGEAWGITREAVRQNLLHGPFDGATIKAARRAFTAELERIEREAVLAWSEANIGRTLTDAAEELGLPLDRVSDLLGRRRRLHTALRSHGLGRGRSDEDLLDDLRRFHAETGERSGAAFDAWSAQAGVPGKQTSIIRFGGWNRALRLAGVADTPSIVRERRHSDEDLWAALVMAIREGNSSVNQVDAWLRRQEGAPCFALIRQRLAQPWSALHGTVLEVLAGSERLDPAWIAEVTRPREWDVAPSRLDPVAVVRAAIADLGPYLTVHAYANWAKEHHAPVAATLLRRYGHSWVDLVRAAGGQAGAARPHRVGPEEALDALRRFFADHPDGSSHDYIVWRRTHPAPVLGTLNAHFGTWAGAKEQALGRTPELRSA